MAGSTVRDWWASPLAGQFDTKWPRWPQYRQQFSQGGAVTLLKDNLDWFSFMDLRGLAGVLEAGASVEEGGKDGSHGWSWGLVSWHSLIPKEKLNVNYLFQNRTQTFCRLNLNRLWQFHNLNIFSFVARIFCALLGRDHVGRTEQLLWASHIALDGFTLKLVKKSHTDDTKCTLWFYMRLRGMWQSSRIWWSLNEIELGCQKTVVMKSSGLEKVCYK